MLISLLKKHTSALMYEKGYILYVKVCFWRNKIKSIVTGQEYRQRNSDACMDTIQQCTMQSRVKNFCNFYSRTCFAKIIGPAQYLLCKLLRKLRVTKRTQDLLPPPRSASTSLHEEANQPHIAAISGLWWHPSHTGVPRRPSEFPEVLWRDVFLAFLYEVYSFNYMGRFSATVQWKILLPIFLFTEPFQIGGLPWPLQIPTIY
jgi:hypothetical protein